MRNGHLIEQKPLLKAAIFDFPKVKQPLCESDTRPISLTPILSKALEDFVVS